MLTALSIRDVVLIQALDLTVDPGLTALTGETGAGKSIVLDALGLALGARADASLVRRGADMALCTAVFGLAPGHPAFAVLEAKGLSDGGDEVILRRQVSADGRSRAYVNDQPTSVAVLKELGALLLEVHGQHDAVGLMDARTHRGLLDSYGVTAAAVQACRMRWSEWRTALGVAEALRIRMAQAAAEAEEIGLRLAELDRLDPKRGEEAALAAERTLLGASEKVVDDIVAAQEAFSGGQIAQRLAQASRALQRALDRVKTSGRSPGQSPDDAGASAVQKLSEAAAAVERALIEVEESASALDAAADVFVFDPTRLEKTEERLFALRAAARRLNVTVEDLPAQRLKLAEALRGLETADEALAAADAEAKRAQGAYWMAARALSEARKSAALRLSAAVEAELKPLKLEKARFHVAVDALEPDRAGPEGADRVAFQVATNPGAPFGPLGDIASGGELARFALALKASLAARSSAAGEGGATPVMIFDEVDQGVGGAVADAVGLRLKGLAKTAQVLVVTHSPQVAARADAHWRVSKSVTAEATTTAITPLSPKAREEEIARMLAGAEVTDAARAAARALMA